MNKIKFWFDFWTGSLHLVHEKTGRLKQVKCPKKIRRFLRACRLSRNDLKGVREGDDLLGFFKRK